MNSDSTLFVGLMSGTSVDAIDCALARCEASRFHLLASYSHSIPQALRQRIADLSLPGANEIERMGALDRELGQLFAEATLALLQQTGTTPAEVCAIGSHGQTIRHRPPSTAGKSPGFTLQIGDPNTIAEVSGITTVADFRRADMAAGGEGAPLAPAFHAAMLSEAGVNRAVVNIGGIANVTFLQGEELLCGFDTGPGNTLLDHWIGLHQGDAYDAQGQWAAAGQVQADLLQELMSYGYFSRSGPRSTGKEEFNLAWLEERLPVDTEVAARDVQATLAELTCRTIAEAILGHSMEVTEVYVCGGGCHNAHLMQRLQALLAPATVASTATIGLDPDWVEAATFAWLASRTMSGMWGNSPAVTGASGPRILGGVYAAKR